MADMKQALEEYKKKAEAKVSKGEAIPTVDEFLQDHNMRLKLKEEDARKEQEKNEELALNATISEITKSLELFHMNVKKLFEDEIPNLAQKRNELMQLTSTIDLKNYQAILKAPAAAASKDYYCQILQFNKNLNLLKRLEMLKHLKVKDVDQSIIKEELMSNEQCLKMKLHKIENGQSSTSGGGSEGFATRGKKQYGAFGERELKGNTGTYNRARENFNRGRGISNRGGKRGSVYRGARKI